MSGVKMGRYSGTCPICGRDNEDLHHCKVCGADVCHGCFVSDVHTCTGCMRKGLWVGPLKHEE
ncbi:MAG: hypothetical protein AB1476_01585 [Candidatus Hadarchaeota archaeon]